MTDMTKISSIGMSLGGSAAALAAHRDGRIAAAINLDGPQLGTELLDAQIRVPTLVLHSDAVATKGGGAITDSAYEPRRQLGESGKVHRWIIEGSGHLDFSDLTLYPIRMFRALMGQGDICGTRKVKIVAEICTTFLDKEIGKRLISGL